jgi:hypothetical protein
MDANAPAGSDDGDPVARSYLGAGLTNVERGSNRIGNGAGLRGGYRGGEREQVLCGENRIAGVSSIPVDADKAGQIFG